MLKYSMKTETGEEEHPTGQNMWVEYLISSVIL